MTIQDMFYSLKKYGFVQDGAERPENSISPDGKRIKKNGKWVTLPDTTKFAKKLNPAIWGTTEEIQEKAKLTRKSDSFDKTRDILNEIALKSKSEPLKSSDGLEAELSKKKVDKILSGKATDKSFELKAHLMAAANADQLFKNSVEAIEPRPDKNGAEDIKAIHHTYAPMEWNGKIIPVKFTIKEYKNENERNKLYTIEAIDCDLTKKIENVGNLDGK